MQELDKADILAFPKSLFAGVKPNAWDKRCEEILEDQYNIDPRIKLNEETGVKIGWRWEDKDESKCS